MRVAEIKELTRGTSDPAFAVDESGTIVAWNEAAATLFGVPVQEALGRTCQNIVQGSDECGQVCSSGCTILQALRRRQTVQSFDMRVHTAEGARWCNVSVLVVGNGTPASSVSLHILHSIDAAKRLELSVRDFLLSETALSPDQARAVMSSSRAVTRAAVLTPREIEILRLLAKGGTTTSMAGQLGLSRTTVNNHVQHILSKLDAHTRLEAVRRAERAGLI